VIGSSDAHLRLCASKNTKIALLYVLFCVVCTSSWFLTQPSSLGTGGKLLWFGLVATISILVQLFIAMNCIRERVVLGCVIASFLIRLVSEIAPGVVNADAGLIGSTRQVLWGVASIISITMLVSSIRFRVSQSQ
jgi:hypothetical protein